MEALALTDHGNMYGMIKFHAAATAEGIKPIYGCEVYQAPRSMTQKEAQLDRDAYHLILLAMNKTGYANLLQLVTKANLEGFYYRPRIDRELLAQHADETVSDEDFARERRPDEGWELRSKEELMYYRLFRECCGRASGFSWMGRTKPTSGRTVS